jgi:hypothetical protein
MISYILLAMERSSEECDTTFADVVKKSELVKHTKGRSAPDTHRSKYIRKYLP